jgi:hypothetical protein
MSFRGNKKSEESIKSGISPQCWRGGEKLLWNKGWRKSSGYGNGLMTGLGTQRKKSLRIPFPYEVTENNLEIQVPVPKS